MFGIWISSIVFTLTISCIALEKIGSLHYSEKYFAKITKTADETASHADHPMENAPKVPFVGKRLSSLGLPASEITN